MWTHLPFYAMVAGLAATRTLLGMVLHAAVTHPNSPLAQTLASEVSRSSQVHKEGDWMIPIWFHTAVFLAAHHLIGFADTRPPAFSLGIQALHCLAGHCLLTEPLYYALHRWLHVPWVFKAMHSFHHAFRYTDPLVGMIQDHTEHALYVVVFGAYFVGATLANYTFSPWIVYLYMVTFDICNAVGHFDVEWWPRWFVDSPLRFVFYSPSYHAVHHREYGHFCLFSPFWDWLFGTYRDAAYRQMFQKLYFTASRSPPSTSVTTAVFVGHYLGPTSPLYTPWVSRARRERPIETDSYYEIVLGWLLGQVGALLCETIPTSICTFQLQMPDNSYREVRLQSVVLPYEAQAYHAKHHGAINRTLLRVADRYTPDHLILGANNKMGTLNRYGTDLHGRVRDGTTLSHGNTNTAVWCLGTTLTYWPHLQMCYGARPVAVVTGASSSIGKALVCLLLEKGCCVHFVTSQRNQYEQYVAENGASAQLRCVLRHDQPKFHGLLRSCDLWCMGVLPTPAEQSMPSREATVLNFSAMSMTRRVSHCRVIDIGTMRLADDGPLRHNARHFMGMGRGELHSCLVGGILRALEGERRHEPVVGALGSSEVQQRMVSLGALGFIPPVPSLRFHDTSSSSPLSAEMLPHLLERLRWYPHDKMYLEITTCSEGLGIFDCPVDTQSLHRYLKRSGTDGNTQWRCEVYDTSTYYLYES